MHPGNILLDDTRAGRAPTLVLLDAGMVARLGPSDRGALLRLFAAMGAGDGRAAADALLACGRGGVVVVGVGCEPASAAAAADEPFRRAMAALFASHCRGFRTGTDVGAVLRAVLALLRDHGVPLGGPAAGALCNLLCVESFASALQPNRSLLDGCEGLLTAHRWLGDAGLRVAGGALAPGAAAARAAAQAAEWGLPWAARGAWARLAGGRAGG